MRSRIVVMLAVVVTGAALMVAVPAGAAPRSPRFGPAIDGYASYDPQDECIGIAQPGVLGFKDLLNQTYGPHNWDIVRECNDGDPSEHKEGRALDWFLNAANAGDRAVANDIFAWLFATDRHGNTHAFVRRLGVMYIIWNRQIWSSYNVTAGWRPYTGPNPHIDHIHFSFSWAGARKQTTWWTAALPTTNVSDFSGDGHADVLGVDAAGVLWYYPNNGLRLPSRIQIGSGWQTFRHVAAADFSGDGHADVLGVDAAGVLWYYPNNGLRLPSRIQIGSGWQTFRHMAAADFSGDGHADVLGVDAAGVLWYYPNNGLRLPSRIQIGSGWQTFRHMLAADFSGDGHADVSGVDAAGLLWYYPNNGLRLPSRIQIGSGWQTFPFVM